MDIDKNKDKTEQKKALSLVKLDENRSQLPEAATLKTSQRQLQTLEKLTSSLKNLQRLNKELEALTFDLKKLI